MPALIDLSGDIFDRITVVDRSSNGKNGGARWDCVCKCGNKTTVAGGDLRSGHTRSCGCFRVTNAIRRGKLGATHKMSKTPVYRVWSSMKSRCMNNRDKDYPNYGGRGIEVCERWLNSFECFVADMGTPWKGMTIDRINTDGNYELKNCRWATRSDQSRNRRTNKLTIDQARAIRNDTRGMRDIAHSYDVSVVTVSNIKRNISWVE